MLLFMACGLATMSCTMLRRRQVSGYESLQLPRIIDRVERECLETHLS